jgi:hypothetical protein
MNRAFEEELAHRWRDVFRGRDLPETNSLALFGAEHGDGWHSLLDALGDALTTHARELRRDPVGAFRIRQELARLNFLPDRPVDIFERAVVWIARKLSGCICELSGAPGKFFHCGNGFSTLAPDVALRRGCLPPTVGSDRQLPPVPWQELLHRLAPDARAIIEGPVDIPPGWADLVELLLTELSRTVVHEGAPTARVRCLHQRDGRLHVDLEDARQWDAGAAAFLSAMSVWIDPETGAAHVPNAN